MPFVLLSPDGEVEAMFLDNGDGRTYMPLSDMRILRFLQASDPALARALLNASDDGHRILLCSLIGLLVDKQILPGATVLQLRRVVPHESVTSLLESVETSEEEALLSLAQSDRNMVRLIEDVIDLLVGQGVFRLEDLPPRAQHLLEMRRALRAYLADGDRDEELEFDPAPEHPASAG